MLMMSPPSTDEGIRMLAVGAESLQEQPRHLRSKHQLGLNPHMNFTGQQTCVSQITLQEL